MDASLITAGVTAALAAAGYAGSRGSHGKKQGRSARRAQSRSVGPAGMTPTKTSDLRVKPPTQLNVPSKVPKVIAGVIAWDSVKLNSGITSSTTTLVETNFSFNLGQHPQASSWTALFDQYCIVQATVSFDSAVPPGSTASPPQLITALDFDNIGALGSIAAIEDYATSEVINMAPGTRHMRSVRPCNKGVVTSTASAVPQRTWVDCGSSTIPHYGIRSIVQQGTVSQPITVTTTIVFAFRNQI
jgi:hypothetical protein